MPNFFLGASASDEIDYAVIATTTSGPQIVVAGIPGKRIMPVFIVVAPTMATIITWRSNTTMLGGGLDFDPKGKAFPGFCPVGYFITAVGEDLIMDVSNATNIGGHMTYAIKD